MERHPRRLPVVADFTDGKDPYVPDEPRVPREDIATTGKIDPSRLRWRLPDLLPFSGHGGYSGIIRFRYCGSSSMVE